MGILFKAPAAVIYIVTSIWSLFITFGIVADHLGRIVAIIGLVIFPALLYLAPFYAGIAEGNWFPLALSFGGTIAAGALMTIGQKIDGDN